MSYVDEEKYNYKKAKRSKAGNLHVEDVGAKKSYDSSKPEAVVKIAAWANTARSVKNMMDYISRTTNMPQEDLEPRDLLAELEQVPGAIEDVQFSKEVLESYVNYINDVSQLCTDHEKYLEKHKKISLPKRQKLNRQLQTEIKKKTDFVQRHVSFMAEAFEIPKSLEMKITNAVGRCSKDAMKGSLHKAVDKCTGQIYDTLEQLKIPSESLERRTAAKAAAVHRKARSTDTPRLIDSTGREYKGATEIKRLYDRWAKDFDRKKGKKQPRHAVHIALSAKADLTPQNLKKVEAAAAAVAKRHFGDKGYDFAVGVHQDGKYPHAHLIVKCKPIDSEQTKKLDVRKKDIQAIRKTFAKELTARGLEHQATRQKDRNIQKAPKKERPSNWKDKKQDILTETRKLIENMGKEQKKLDRQLTRDQAKVDALYIREAQARSLETQRDKIKALPKDDPGREDAFKELREFRRSLNKGVKMEQESSATMNKIVDDMEKWEKKMETLDAKRQRGDLSADQQADLKREIQGHMENGNKIMDRAERFQKQIKESSMPVEQKKEMYGRVATRSRQMGKAQERLRGQSR